MGGIFGRVSRSLPGQGKGGKWRALGAGAALLGCAAGWQAPALADDKSSDTYAGDYAGGALPAGTFIALQYAGVSHSDAFVTPTGKAQQGSGANTYEEFSRFVYFSTLFGHPFVIEGEIPFATLTDAKFDSGNGAGVTSQTVAGGLVDPVIHLTYYFIADPKIDRFLGFTNYFYLPAGRSYDNLKTINVSTPHQFTDVPQIGYTEGLEKFAPMLKGVSLDIVANASFHTNGDSPVAVAPGIQFDRLTQDTSYDFKAFLRYNWNPLGFVAVGYEGSWGGKQTASGGLLGAQAGPTVLGTDEYQRGHIQAQMPLAPDTAIGADIFHDFSATGGFREDIGVELRLTKIFAPQAPMK